MAFNLGNLAGLGGLTQSSALLARQQQEAERLKIEKTLQAIAMQQQEQQQLGAGLASKAIRGYDPGQIPQPPMAPLGGGPDQLLGAGGGGMPQSPMATRDRGPLRGGGMVSGLPAPGAVKGSWFGNSPGWQDPSDSGLQASGVPVAGNPGIALPSRAGLGQPFDVTTPDGRTFTLPQTDVGPAKWTGRGVDINAPAAEAMGYTPKNFPTDQQFIVKAHNQLDNEVGQKGIKLIQQGASPPAIKESTGLAKAAGREIDPQQWGMAGLHQMMQVIDKADPDAPEAVKWAALGQLNKLLAPEEKLRAQMYMKEHQQELSIVMKDLQIAQAQAGQAETHRHNIAEEEIQRTRADSDKGGQIFQSGDKFFRATPQGNVQPLDLPAGATKAGTQPRNAPAMALRTFMEEFQTREGRAPSSEEVRNFQATSAEALSEARTIGTSSANLERASNAAAALIPLVRETSNAISRTDYPNVNSLILAYETKTGDPKVVQYGEMVNSLRYLYARALAPSGQGPRVADINHFDEIFNKAWSSGQVDAALDQIQRAIGIEKGATQKTKSEILGKSGQGAAPSFPMMSREQIQQQLAPENWSKLTPEQQSAVARRVEELERGLK